VEFPALDEAGFDVYLGVNALEIILSGGILWHRHLKFVTNPKELVERAFGQIRTMLCPDTRLLEKYSNGIIYSATMEEYDGVKWIRGKAVTLIFWNYFGNKTKKTLKNRHMPAVMSL
jgi:hypothetical protein